MKKILKTMKFSLFSLIAFAVFVQVYSLDSDKLLRINVQSQKDADLVHEFGQNNVSKGCFFLKIAIRIC